MLFKPRNLVAAAAVLALFFFGLKPWETNSQSGGGWWIAPPSAWAGELRATIDKASRQSFCCREQFVNRTKDGVMATSSTANTLFVCGDRYRRDVFDQDHLRETQWYVHSPQELIMTGVQYREKHYSVTHHPKTQQGEDANPLRRIEALPGLLAKSGRRIGIAKVDGRDAVEFEIEAKAIDAQDDAATIHVWLDQATKLPLKVTYEFAPQGGLGSVIATTLVQDQFEWNPPLPANTFDPQIPTGYSQKKTE